MTVDDLGDGLRWFHRLDPDDQVTLLRRPDAELSADLVSRLLARKVSVAGTTWVSQQTPTRWMVDPALANALRDIRLQFDEWWQRRTDEERVALIEQRHDELSADYRAMIMAANEHPLERNRRPVFVIVADNRTGRFRMPPILAVYLELKARGG